jgi:hypothetical protein
MPSSYSNRSSAMHDHELTTPGRSGPMRAGALEAELPPNQPNEYRVLLRHSLVTHFPTIGFGPCGLSASARQPCPGPHKSGFISGSIECKRFATSHLQFVPSHCYLFFSFSLSLCFLMSLSPVHSLSIYTQSSFDLGVDTIFRGAVCIVGFQRSSELDHRT